MSDQEIGFEEEDNTVEEIRAVFASNISESEEDDVKLLMIQAGATFKNVTRLYNQFMIDAGLAISKADRDQIVSDTLSGKEFESQEDFEHAVALIADAVQGTTERSASALVRSYAKRNELECYTKPKGEGTRSTFSTRYYDWLAANPNASEDEAQSFILGEGDHEETSENTKRHLSHYQSIRSLANRVAQAS